MFRIITLKIQFLLRQVFAFALLILGGSSGAWGQDSLTIYFYNPEINTTRNVVLKTVFDQYLSERGQFQFQPVDNRRTFEALIQSDTNAIFMISDWHYRQLENLSSPTTPALRGVKNNNDTYRKFLVARNPNPNLETITIATSGSLPFSRSILSDIYPELAPERLAKPKFLVVPKDIDALMAVGFGLADAALATELSLNTLSTLYKKQHQQLTVLGESRPLKQLLVIHHQIPPPLKAEAIVALTNMAKNNKGMRALNILGLNGWQLLDENQSKYRRPAQ